MKLVRNTGNERVMDVIQPWFTPGRQLDVVTPKLSLFAFAEVFREVSGLARGRFLLPPASAELAILGSDADRGARNHLQTRWLASRLAQWLESKAELRRAPREVPQGAFVLRDGDGRPLQVLFGSLAFTTGGLGLTPGNPLSLIQASETPEEAELLSQWFDAQWFGLAADSSVKVAMINALQSLATHRDPFLVYALILYHLFHERGEEMDEERIVKSATGIRNTIVWKKLYRFQRDGGKRRARGAERVRAASSRGTGRRI